MSSWLKKAAMWATHEDVWAINRTYGGQVLRAHLGTRKREWVVTLNNHPIFTPMVFGAVLWFLISVIRLDGNLIQRSGGTMALVGALMQYIVVSRRKSEIFSEVLSGVEKSLADRMTAIATTVRDRHAREVGTVHLPNSGIAERIKKYENDRLSFLGSFEFILVIAGSLAAIFGDWLAALLNCRSLTC